MVDVTELLEDAYRKFPSDPARFSAGKQQQALEALFQAAMAHANWRIADFDDRARRTSGPARRLRSWAIFFFVLGTGAPVINGLLRGLPVAWVGRWAQNVPTTEIGYIFLLIAGGLVLYDRFFNQSGTWIRARQAEARIRALQAKLRYDWPAELGAVGGAVSQPADVERCIRVLGVFVVAVEEVAEAETREWAEYFRTQISTFDGNLKLEQERLQAEIDKAMTAVKTPAGGAEAAKENGASSGGTSPAAAGSDGDAAGFVTLRAAIDDFDGYDPGSAELAVDGKPVSLSANGTAELRLAIGVEVEVTAEAVKGGRAHTFAEKRTPTADDDGDAYPIALV